MLLTALITVLKHFVSHLTMKTQKETKQPLDEDQETIYICM